MEEKLRIGDEIIAEGYKWTLYVASIGKKTVGAKFKAFPFIIRIPKEKIIFKSRPPIEVAKKRLEGLADYEPVIVLRKKKKLEEMV